MPTARMNPGSSLLIALALGAATLSGCSTAPRLTDRPTQEGAGSDAAEAIAALERRRAEARRIVRLAEEAEANDDPEEAIERYAEALRLDDTMQNAWNNVGTLLMEADRYADAVDAFQRASQLLPADPRPEYNIGVAYQKNGWGEDAYRHFGNAMARDPSHLPSLRGFVRASEMTGRADLELIDVIKSATLRETDPVWREYFLRQRYRVEAVLEDR
ncbi:MAG: tetratricopeptide repeat protein [Planctomycetota bacterium]